MYNATLEVRLHNEVTMDKRTTLHGLHEGVLVSVALKNKKARRKGEVTRTFEDPKHGPCIEYRGIRDGGLHTATVGEVRVVRRRRLKKVA